MCIVLQTHKASLNVNFTTGSTVQISTWAGGYAWLANDGDLTTCSLTGFHTQPWWKLDLGQLMKVMGISVTGKS